VRAHERERALHERKHERERERELAYLGCNHGFASVGFMTVC
jgi:hypothetical protein